jgi:WD40 repeat protein
MAKKGKSAKGKKGKLEVNQAAESAEQSGNNAGEWPSDGSWPQELPPGADPVMIEDQNMKKYGLKTGENIADTVKYKLFAYNYVMEDLKLGIYSSFHFAKGMDGKERSWLDTYPDGEEFVVVADVDYRYGENWIMATTVEAKEGLLDIVLAEERALKAIEDARLAAIAAKEAKEEAIRNAVYKEVAMKVRPYSSQTVEETTAAINLFTESPDRPRIKHRLMRKRKYFGAPVIFADDDAEHNGVKEFRQHKDPNFDLRMKEHETGLQVGPVMMHNRSVETQTLQNRSVNRSTQYEPMSLDESRADVICQQSAFLKFMEKACYDCEVALQQNETIDVFRNELSADNGEGNDDEATLSSQASDSEVQKLRSLKHLIYSKEKTIPCIDWHPRKTGTVVHCTEDHISFNERSERAGTARKAFSLVWRIKDLNPHIVLESQFECTQVKYNPHQPNLIAGGLHTGQVVLWDTAKREEELEFERLNSHVGPDGGAKEPKEFKPLPAIDTSSIDQSHTRAVEQLMWLPVGMELSAKGDILYSKSKEIHQFATISTDGKMNFWDIRFREAKSKGRKQKPPNGKSEIEESTWAPIFSIVLKQESGSGALPVRRMLLPLVEPDAHSATTVKPPMCCFATDNGQLASVDVAAAASATDDETGVAFIRQDHFRPTRSLERSPFFPDIVVSVGDWDFNIWKEGFDTPLFTSSMSPTYLRGAKWSPTRPGILFVARYDGQVDIWDLADQSHKPSAEIAVGLSPIDSMEFWTSSRVPEKATVLLAVSDQTGALHILQLSKQLTRPINNELTLISAYFDREFRHQEYVQERFAAKTAAGKERQGGEMTNSQSVPKTALEDDEVMEEQYKQIEEHYRELFGV